jgi:2TM domain-containing protein
MDDWSSNRVQKRVKKKKGFLTHLGVYVAMAIFFLTINIATFSESGEWWFFFPMIPWGVGLLIHYFSVFGFPGTRKMVEKWEIEETAREIKKMRESGVQELPSGQEMEDGLELPELKRRKDPLYNDDEFV